MNVVLIGMPGAGKSTLGVLLAKKLLFSFCDTDLVLQQRYGDLLGDILAKNGNDAFLALEDEMMCTLDIDRTVIATGGSAIYSDAGMRHLKENGLCVYLDVPYEALKERLGDLKKRGVVLPDGFTLKDLYDQRAPLYRKYADITVDASEARFLDDAMLKVYDAIRSRI